MKKRLLFILLLTFISCVSVIAQRKSITNADLEKFKEKRLQAEKDYRENYEKLGMPSPEELDRRAEQKRIEYAEAAARFRTERLRDEQYRADREQSESSQYYYGQPQSFFNQTPYYSQPYYTPGSLYPANNYLPYGYGSRPSNFDNLRRVNNRPAPIFVLTPENMVKRIPITTTNRRNSPRSPRGRH